MCLTTTQLQSFLRALEVQVDFFAMQLNQTKTELLVDPNLANPPIKFKDGTLVPTTTQIKYVGSMI